MPRFADITRGRAKDDAMKSRQGWQTARKNSPGSPANGTHHSR